MVNLPLERIGGSRLFTCASCDTELTNREELISTGYRGTTGKANLFERAVNLNYSDIQESMLLTGKYLVRDVSCKNCHARLGWKYEYAMKDDQRYKEGKVVLELALLTEKGGFDDRRN